MRRESINDRILRELYARREHLYLEIATLNARIGGVNDSIKLAEDIKAERLRLRKAKADK